MCDVLPDVGEAVPAARLVGPQEPLARRHGPRRQQVKIFLYKEFRGEEAILSQSFEYAWLKKKGVTSTEIINKEF